MMNRSKQIVSILFFLSVQMIWAQEKTTSPPTKAGEIESLQYEIVIDRENIVPPAERIYNTIPPQRGTHQPVDINYQIKPIMIPTLSGSIPSARPLQAKDEPLQKIYNYHFSGGLGNYRHSYFRAIGTTKRDKTKYLAAEFLHNRYGKGPVNGRHSATQNNNLTLSGSLIKNQATLKGLAQYQSQSGYFYGYPSDWVTPANWNALSDRHTQKVGIALQFSNPKDKPISYTAHTSISHLFDQHRARETDLTYGVQTGYKRTENTKIQAGVEHTQLIRKDDQISRTTRQIVRFTPQFIYTPVLGWKTIFGMRMVFASDPGNKIHVYPLLRQEYMIHPQVQLYGEISGNLEKVSWHSLIEQNFWLAPNVPIMNTNRKIEIKTGAQGTIANRINWHIGFSYGWLENPYYFQNQKNNPSNFINLYAPGQNRHGHFFTELSYSINSFLQVYVRDDVYTYQTNVIDYIRSDLNYSKAQVSQPNVALHLPTHTFSGTLYWNISDKFSGQVSGLLRQGMKTVDYERTSERMIRVASLQPSIDLNVRLEYGVSNTFTLFVLCNNVLDKTYPLFYNYPVRGRQFRGGLNLRM